MSLCTFLYNSSQTVNCLTSQDMRITFFCVDGGSNTCYFRSVARFILSRRSSVLFAYCNMHEGDAMQHGKIINHYYYFLFYLLFIYLYYIQQKDSKATSTWYFYQALHTATYINEVSFFFLTLWML